MNTLFEQSQTNRKDEWLTPPSIIKALGEFDLDPCAPIERKWSMAKNHYTTADDGLSLPWTGRVWLNPPYSENKLWLSRMVRHGDGIVLIFARTDTEWFIDYVWKKATGIMFLWSRLTFLNVDGTKAKSNAGAPSVLIAYGEENYTALEKSGLRGKTIHL